MKFFSKIPILLFSVALAGSVAFLLTGNWPTAAGPFLHVEDVTGGRKSACSIRDLNARLTAALPQVEKHMYFQMWRKVMHVEGWDPVRYISEKLPEEGTCHGKVFAIQRYIYSYPKASAQEAASQYAVEDVVLFDVMRLAYTELFRYIVADGIVTEGTKNGLFDSLETLIDGTIKHIQKRYFSDQASGNSGYLQIIVYQIQ